MRPQWYLFIAALAALCACTAPAPPPAVESQLYFGRGRTAPDADWERFVADIVTPRFPDGFTILDATGQYRTRDGHIGRERTKILIVAHDGSPAHIAALHEIAAAYRTMFHQESVLEVDLPATMTLLGQGSAPTP
jgi:hypothetical protein